MGEFFVISRYQGKGVASQALKEFFKNFTWKWEVTVIPENILALNFWRKNIKFVTKDKFKEEICKVDYDAEQPNRVLFSFTI